MSGNDNKDGNLIALVDMINSNIQNNVTQKLNIPDYSTNSKNNFEQETLDEEEESKQSLNPNSDQQNLLDMNDSGIIQIPNSYIEEQKQSYNSDEIDNANTLDESILKTIKRDMKSISYKLKYILNPYSSPLDKKFHIMNWDLWGPLLFITLLSCILTLKTKEKSNVMVSVFSIFWIGSFLVYLNATLLDSKIRIFPIICLLGYCLFPLIVAAFILSLVNIHDILKLLLVGLMCFYSLFCIYSYIKTLCEKDQKILVFYPVVLMFIFISWFIFVN